MASQEQVDATVAELTPFMEFDRTKIDRDDPRFKSCVSGCGCPGRVVSKTRTIPDQCTPGCSGTCYEWGGKSITPGGSDDSSGVDCSGLIAQENQEFWKKANILPKRCPDNAETCDLSMKTGCPDLGDGNDCLGGAQQQLQLLIDSKRDDIGDAQDLRGGDVAYFADESGRVDHVVQVIGNPNCDAQGCSISIVDSLKTGEPVQKRTLLLDLKDCVKGSGLCFYKGGTPPAGDRTGGAP